MNRQILSAAGSLAALACASLAYSGEALIQQNVRSLPEVATLTPGLTIVSGQTSPTGLLFQMRGQAQIASKREGWRIIKNDGAS